MKQAFTLVELLVVVLIIGILTAVALPMYQGAVDKSHWSTMLPAAKAIKDAEEAIKMTNGEYTSQMDDLDVTMNNADLNFTLDVHNNLSDPNVIRVTNPKLANVRLASYLEDSPKFAGQLHCEAATGDERANRLCEKLLNGGYLKTTDDGYTRYLLDQSVDKATCGAATGSWSSSKTKCYSDSATRCSDLGMGVIAGMDDQCGYENGTNREIGEEGLCLATVSSYGEDGCAYSTIKNGGTCKAQAEACNRLIVEEGGQCIGESGNSCYQLQKVEGRVICKGGGVRCGLWGKYDGGICVGIGGYQPCNASTFTNGSICYAHSQGACGNVVDGNDGWSSSYDATSCCCGSFCPDTAPSCASRGVACDPYYMDPNNFKDL